ncbi:MAG: integral rane protein MviN [Myxococcaceae bacterium]|nr:integral rane protein MviN [Myxococcaceae bacterium]
MTVEPTPAAPPSRVRGSVAVAAGILASRVAGLVRQSVFAYFLGATAAADVFNAAFKIPNVLQNVLGEGAVSASFIPVYARLRAEGRDREAVAVAGAVATLLALVTAALVVLGVACAPLLVGLIAPGFEGVRRAETLALVRIFFPAVGLLVLSAWCLGILNSHRRFFLPYAVPMASSATVIAALCFTGIGADKFTLAHAAAWGIVAGALLQLAVQLPAALRLVAGVRPSLGRASADVRAVVTRFSSAFLSRGVAQLSGYVDQMLASYLPESAVTVLANAQTLNLLPISLFGTAISAAQLPEMASATGTPAEIHRAVVARLDAGLRRIAFFVIPSAVAFVALGGDIAGLLFQRGAFTRADTEAVWATLAGSSVGLLGQTMARLTSSAFYALGDTRTPMRVAAMRLALTGALGYVFAFPLTRALGLDLRWGTVGLSASAGVAGWIEYALLRAALARRVGPHGAPPVLVAQLWSIALSAAGAAWTVRLPLRAAVGDRPMLVAPVTLGVFGLSYLAAGVFIGNPEARRLRVAVLRRLGRRGNAG